MEGLSRGEIRQLLEARSGPCVTLFMPTHDTGADIAQDTIRLKNLVRRAEDQLREKGLRNGEIEALMNPARELLGMDRIFWRSPKASFVLLLAPGFSRYHHLPMKVDETVYVDSRFHLKPMLRLLSANNRFYVLALSQDEIRLLQGTQYGVRQVPLKGAPANFAEATELVEAERQHQMRQAGNVQGAGGTRAGSFHGQGLDANEEHKIRLQEYFRAIDRAVVGVIAGESAPLILAGVEYLLPLYRDVNNHPHLLETSVTGNPELLSAEQLHGLAWPIARTFLETAERDAMARFQNLTGSTRSSIDLKEILSAAHAGRVDSLFVAGGLHIWGTYDPEADEVIRHQAPGPNSTDLLDLAAAETFLTAGRVFVFEPNGVPGGEGIAAVFRY